MPNPRNDFLPLEYCSLHATQKAADALPMTALSGMFKRHASGDWGDVHDGLRVQNDAACMTGGETIGLYDHDGKTYVLMTGPRHDNGCRHAIVYTPGEDGDEGGWKPPAPVAPVPLDA